MPIQAVLVAIAEDDEDHASAILWELDTLGVEVRVGAPGETLLVAYFAADERLPKRLREALAPLPGARVEPSAVPDVDWVARFRENFRGFDVGIFHIAPCWDLPVSLLPGQRLILVNPGRAFGTGTHESTRLCLRALADAFREASPQRVLDLGTGTGILAVACALLGASEVTGVDDDAEALESAREHAVKNGVRLDLRLGDGGRALEAGRYDLVVANLTAPLLRERAREIARLARPGGRLVLSGLLAQEAPSVVAAYAASGAVTEAVDGEWASLVFRVPA